MARRLGLGGSLMALIWKRSSAASASATGINTFPCRFPSLPSGDSGLMAGMILAAIHRSTVRGDESTNAAKVALVARSGIGFATIGGTLSLIVGLCRAVSKNCLSYLSLRRPKSRWR
jgi:hypothetical protein